VRLTDVFKDVSLTAEVTGVKYNEEIPEWCQGKRQEKSQITFQSNMSHCGH